VPVDGRRTFGVVNIAAVVAVVDVVLVDGRRTFGVVDVAGNGW
jgi:hypothetical protein